MNFLHLSKKYPKNKPGFIFYARIFEMNKETIKMEDLGYSPCFEVEREKLGLDDFSIARVISEFRGAYRVKNINGEFLAKVTGRQMFRASSREDYPAVGDWVAITELPGEQAVIENILPRLSIIKRKYGDKTRSSEKSEVQVIAANIDVAFVVESVNRDYSLNRFERYFAIAKQGGVRPAIILNKIDLLSREELEEKLMELKKRFPETDIILTSILGSDGLDELRKYIREGKTYCFLGSSGVGKSSLINKLLGEEKIKTREISSVSDRGKHTTTSRQMYFLAKGGIVVDNPGIREVGMADVGEGIDASFDEIQALSKECKYANCAHAGEPGCAVLRAIKKGELDQNKYSNFISLRKEAEYSELSNFGKREKDRQFGKFLKQAKKELRDLDQ